MPLRDSFRQIITLLIFLGFLLQFHYMTKPLTTLMNSVYFGQAFSSFVTSQFVL
jgi:hypothetical protein